MTIADGVAALALRRPRLCILVSIALSLVLAAGIARLEFASDYRIFFDPDGTQRQGLDRLEKSFGLGEGAIVVLRPTRGTVYAAPFLTAVRELQTRLKADPAVTWAASPLDLDVKRVRDGFPEVEPVAPAGKPITAATVREVRARARGDPTVFGRLVRKDGGALAIVFEVSPGGKLEATADRLYRIEADFRRRHPGIETGMTGVALLNDGFIQSTVRDMALFLPLTALALLLAMIILLRRLQGVVGAQATVILSAAGAMGVAGWFGWPLNPAVAGAPVVVLTIAIAGSIHLFITYQRRLGAGLGNSDAVHQSVRSNFLPISLTNLTTLFGLLSLNFSDAPPFQDLGNIAAIGIALAWIHTFLFLPAMLVIWPARPGRALREETGVLHTVAEMTLRRPLAVVLLFVALGGASIALTPRLVLNDVYFRYLDRDLAVRQGTDFNIRHLPGACTLHWRLDAPNVLSADFLRRVDGLAVWLRGQGKVHHVLNPVDLVRRETGGRLPPDAARALEQLNGARAEMSDPRAMDRMIRRDGRALHLMVSLTRASSRDVQRLSAGAQAYLATHLPGVADKAATGPCVLFANIAETNIRSMLWGTLVAFILVALTLLLALRQVWLGALSLVPNLLPPVMAFGFWSLAVGEVGLAASVTAATALGIIVDATIHLTTRYRRARAAGEEVDRAVHTMLAGVGVAVWVAALIVIGGFAVLALSSFQVNRDVGLLTVLTLTAALATDLLLLPALLKLFDRRGRSRSDG